MAAEDVSPSQRKPQHQLRGSSTGHLRSPAGGGSSGAQRRQSDGDDYDPKLHHSELSLRRLILLCRSRRTSVAFAALLLLPLMFLLLALSLERRGKSVRVLAHRPRVVGSHTLDRGDASRTESGGRRSIFRHGQNYRGRREGYEKEVEDERRGRRWRRRVVEPMTEQLTSSERRKKDVWYDKKRRYPIGDGRGGHCDAQHRWQETSFPSCNIVHETDLSNLRAKMARTDGSSSSVEMVDLINNGGWSDVWMVREYDGTKRVLKNKLYKHDFTDRNFDRYRRDALVMERLTSYPNVMNIYGFCGVTHLVEYSEGGDISDARVTDKLDKLDIAAQVARSIADLHNFDREGRASVSSTDITPYQFLLIDGVYKLNDFNRARFIGWDTEKDKPCPFYVSKNPGNWRAPEEYNYEGETEKIDVYSLGNIIYFILTGKKPFDSMKTELVQEMVVRGDRPHVHHHTRESDDPVDISLLTAMRMCMTHDPRERASARDVANYLTSQLKALKS